MPRQSLKSAAPRLGRPPVSTGLGADPRNAGSSRRFYARRLLPIWLIFFLAVCALLSRSGAAQPPSPPFRIAFTSSMFADVNENDVRAAVKVWGELIAREQNVPTDPDPIIFKNLDATLRSLRGKEVDAVGATMTEYNLLRRNVPFDPIFLTYNAGRITEQYVLLAHREGAVKTLGDLRGRSLRLHTNPRACLAPLWLDTLLVRQGHPMAARFTDKIYQDSKLSKVVLPVFFRQADACVVTRSGFVTMSELNPQLPRQLAVLAESPEMVPAVFAFRADYRPVFKDRIISGVNGLKRTPAGRQVLTIFHSEDIEEHPASRLDTALELIATHQKAYGR